MAAAKGWGGKGAVSAGLANNHQAARAEWAEWAAVGTVDDAEGMAAEEGMAEEAAAEAWEVEMDREAET